MNILEAIETLFKECETTQECYLLQTALYNFVMDTYNARKDGIMAQSLTHRKIARILKADIDGLTEEDITEWLKGECSQKR